MGRGCKGGRGGETTLTLRAYSSDRCCVSLHNDSMTSLLSLLTTSQFPRMSRSYSVYSFAAIACLRNLMWRPTQEHVASCGGNVVLGNFMRLAEATVCCPGDAGAPQGSKGQRGRSTIQIEAWSGQCLSYTENDDGIVMVLLNLYSRKKDVTTE
jgi:hypothetical protein